MKKMDNGLKSLFGHFKDVLELFTFGKIGIGIISFFSLEVFSLNNTKGFIQLSIFVIIFSCWTETQKLKAIGIIGLKKGVSLFFVKTAQYYFVLIMSKFIDTTVNTKAFEFNGLSISLYQLMFILIILSEAKHVIGNFELIDAGNNKTVLSSIARIISAGVRLIEKTLSAKPEQEQISKEEQLVREIELLRQQERLTIK